MASHIQAHIQANSMTIIPPHQVLSREDAHQQGVMIMLDGTPEDTKGAKGKR